MIGAHIIALASSNFPINNLEVRVKDNMPGKLWVMSFLERHKELSLKRPPSISRFRADINSEGVFF